MAINVSENGHDTTLGRTELARVEVEKNIIRCFNNPITRPILFDDLTEAVEDLRERLSLEYTNPQLQFMLGEEAVVKMCDNGLDISDATIEACRCRKYSLDNAYHLYTSRKNLYRMPYANIQRAFRKIPSKYSRVYIRIYPRRIMIYGERDPSRFYTRDHS